MSESRIGRRYGKLVVLEKVPLVDRYICLCDCGSKKEVAWKHLQRGNTKSCGCLRGDVAEAKLVRHSKEGIRRHPLYETWRGMCRRCESPKSHAYLGYGARGISVCQEWSLDFWKFAKYVGVRPEGTSLDRIDNNGNYEPGNVRWATPQEQGNNKRTLEFWVSLRGEDASTAATCRRLGISEDAVGKARAQGFPPHEAIALAALRKQASKKQALGTAIDWKKLERKIPEALRMLGISPLTS